MRQRTGQHIGIYSGTFDPIHVGHITFALEALRLCQLDKVVFLPEPQPREKSSVTDITKRITAIQKAITDHEGLAVLAPESSQFTTNDTLPRLHELFKDADLTLLVGSDIVRTFAYRWQNLDVLLRDVTLAIGMRLGDEPADIIAIIETLQNKYNILVHYRLIQTTHSHVTSSHIRKSDN